MARSCMSTNLCGGHATTFYEVTIGDTYPNLSVIKSRPSSVFNIGSESSDKG